MYIFEIIIPGRDLNYEDKKWCSKIKNLLDYLVKHFIEANVALNLFNTALKEHPNPFLNQDRYKQEALRIQEIHRSLELQYIEEGKNDYTYEDIEFQAEIILKKENWKKGIIPEAFQEELTYMYAKNFIYALDGFNKFLNVLAKENNVPNSICELTERMCNYFPDLTKVRNTKQHLEDRSRGLGAGKNPKPLDLKPLSNHIVEAPYGGVLILSSLNGSKYGCTMSDGNFGEVDVSALSMAYLKDILDNVLNSFNWEGQKRHMPS